MIKKRLHFMLYEQRVHLSMCRPPIYAQKLKVALTQLIWEGKITKAGHIHNISDALYLWGNI